MTDDARNPSLYQGETTPALPPSPERPEGAGGPPDLDSDPQNGGSPLPKPKERTAPGTEADAKVHGSH